MASGSATEASAGVLPAEQSVLPETVFKNYCFGDSTGDNIDFMRLIVGIKEDDPPVASLYTNLIKYFRPNDTFVSTIQKPYIAYKFGTHEVKYYVHDGLIHNIADKVDHGNSEDFPKLTILHNVGDLYTNTNFKNALFQVETNFNGLVQPQENKFPGPVIEYLKFGRQGGVNCIKTFAALLYRRYIWGISGDPFEFANPTKYKSHPGIFIKDRVPEVYDKLDTTPGGWLDILGVKYDQKILSEKRVKIISMARGVGMIGVSNCSSMINTNSANNICLMTNTSIIINQALCSIALNFKDIRDNHKEHRDNALGWISACLFASYYNTLRFAIEKRLNTVVLTIMQGYSTDPNIGVGAYSAMAFAIKSVKIEYPSSNLRIFVNFDDSDSVFNTPFLAEANKSRDKLDIMEINSRDDLDVLLNLASVLRQGSQSQTPPASTITKKETSPSSTPPASIKLAPSVLAEAHAHMSRSPKSLASSYQLKIAESTLPSVGATQESPKGEGTEAPKPPPELEKTSEEIETPSVNPQSKSPSPPLPQCMEPNLLNSDIDLGNDEIDILESLVGISEPETSPASIEFYDQLDIKFSGTPLQMIVTKTNPPTCYNVGVHSVEYEIPDDISNLVFDMSTTNPLAKDLNFIFLTGEECGNIASLQSNELFKNALFQVELEFNGLEQSDPDKPPDLLKKYYTNKTQGGLAAVGAFAASVYRRYLWGIPGNNAPDDEQTYKYYPGIFVKGDVERVYKGISTTIGGHLHMADPSDQSGAQFFVCGLGVGIIGVQNCSSMITVDRNHRLKLKTKSEILINQAICSTYGTPAHQYTRTTMHKSFMMGSIFSSYYNTLCFAHKCQTNKVILTLLEHSNDTTNGGHDLLALAMMLAFTKYPELKNVKIFMAIRNAASEAYEKFITANKTKNELLYHFNTSEISSMDELNRVMNPSSTIEPPHPLTLTLNPEGMYFVLFFSIIRRSTFFNW